MNKRTIAFFLVLFSAATCLAQFEKYRTPVFFKNYSITNWQSEDGLPQNSVLSILQTPDGYIWCGTQQGIVKFDGVQFFRVLDDAKSSNMNGEILDFTSDENNRLWVLAENEALIEIYGKKIIRPGYIPAKYKNQLNSIHYSNKYGLFVTASAKTFLYKNNKTIDVSPANAASTLEIKFAFEDIDKSVWFLANSGQVFRSTGGKLMHYPFLTAVHEKIRLLDRFKKNGFVAVSKKGLYRIKNDGSFSLTPVFKNYSNPDIRGITEDADGTLWIATLNHGVFAVGINGTIHLGKAEGMSSDFASSVFCDAENNIWVGTFAGGLHKISPRNITSISSADGLTNEFIFSLAEAKNGDLWAGSYGGGAFKISQSKLLNFTTKDGLSANIVRSVLVDKKQNIWFASFAGGLNMYDGKSITNISKKLKLKDLLIHALLETKDGNILAGGSTGITVIGKDSITMIPSPPECANSYIRSFAFDSIGGLWIAYDYAGIAYYKDGKYTTFSGKEGYGYKAARSLFIDKENKVWITSSEGLSLYSGRKFFHFSAVPELNQLVYQIVEDDFGDYWIPTNQGILRISRENLIQFSKGKIRELPLALFNKADGMLSSECNGGNLPAGIKLHTGEIVFPTLKGIAVINPAKIKKQTSFAPLHISSVKGDEKSYFPDENLKLPRGTRRVEITFASLTFRDPQRIKYQYKLSNIDSRFQILLGSRNIIYNHLPAGSYELILYTSNDAGEWAPVPLHFRFSIEPYFYETTFFWLCVAFIIFTIFTLLYFKRVNVLKRRGLMLQKLVEQKTESLNTAKNELEVSLKETLIAKQNLQVLNSQLQEANAVKSHLLDVAAHDLRNPLNAIKGFSQILHEDFERSTEENKLLEHINQASSHMLLLINDLLETSHIGSGKLTFNLKMVDLSYSLKKIVQRNRFIAKKKGQEIFCDIPDDVQVFSDERRVDEIFDNLISNAIKYSPFNTEIHVGLVQNNSHVTVEIKDNGPGLSETDMKRVFGKFERLSALPTAGEASTGLGLAIVKDLVTLLNGSVSVQSEHGKGASFFVTLPVSDTQQK